VWEEPSRGGFYSLGSEFSINIANQYVGFEWLLKWIVIAVLALLDRLGWKRAGKALDLMGDPINKVIGKDLDKDDRPVV
jgi:hypothetical protein